MPKLSILYLMHVPWRWIQQRPHFLANELDAYYNIDICYRKTWTVNKKKLVGTYRDNARGFYQIPFEKIPFLKHFSWLNRLNDILVKWQIGNVNKYDYVWVTSIGVYLMVQRFLPSNAKIIFDCMDDDLEFGTIKNNPILYKKTELGETKLISAASYIFCSSEYLKQKVLSRTKSKNEIHVVNNAVRISERVLGEIPENNQLHELIDKLKNIPEPVIYIGAISEWFNFKLLAQACAQIPTVTFVLFGPKDVDIPDIPNVEHLGTIKQEWVSEVSKYAKVLIMPFVVNELIKSVNPVKLYEYIFACKPIIAPRYSETEKFSKYVNLYSNTEEFVQTLKDNLMGVSKIKIDTDEFKRFAFENTWKSRASQIISIIK